MSEGRYPAGLLGVALTRLLVGGIIIGTLTTTYLSGGGNDSNPLNFFGYFTNQTSLFTASLYMVSGAYLLAARSAPRWLVFARAVALSCTIVVGVIYNTLVPGTGSAPPLVSFLLHTLFPIAAVLDWVLVGDRERLPWRAIWVAVPYPVVWLGVVLFRGVTDGWVPYGFLLPSRGMASLLAHTLLLLGALLAAASAVWLTSRTSGVILKDSRSEIAIGGH